MTAELGLEQKQEEGLRSLTRRHAVAQGVALGAMVAVSRTLGHTGADGVLFGFYFAIRDYISLCRTHQNVRNGTSCIRLGKEE